MPFNNASKPADYLFLYTAARGNMFETTELESALSVDFYRHDGPIIDTFSSGSIVTGRKPETNVVAGVTWTTSSTGSGAWSIADGGGALWAGSNTSQPGVLTLQLTGLALNGGNRTVSTTFTIGTGKFFVNLHHIGYNPFTNDPRACKAEVGQPLRWNGTNGTTTLTAGTHTIRAVCTNWTGSEYTAAIYLDGVLEISGTVASVTGQTTFGVVIDGAATGVKVTDFRCEEVAPLTAATWACRNVAGKTLASGALAAEAPILIPTAALEQYAGSGPCGWYHLLTYGPDRDDGIRGWRDSYGDTYFSVFTPNSEAFPSKPSKAQATSGDAEWDEPTHGYLGMGPLRYAFDATEDPSTVVSHGQSAEDWYRDYGSVSRPRYTIATIPDGAVGLFDEVSDIVDAAKTWVNAWEAFNEPNVGNSTNATNFVTNHMAPFYAAVKASDPTALVLGPSIVQAVPANLQNFITAGGHNYCDGIAIHAYNMSRGDIGRTRRILADVNALLESNSVDLPLWQTEQGAQAEWGGIFNGIEGAQDNSVQVFVQELYGIPMERNVVWYDRSHGFDSFPGNQLSHYLSAPLPGAVVLRTLAAELWDTELASRFDFGSAADVYAGGVFERSDGDVRVGVIAQSSNLPNVVLNVVGAGSSVTLVDPWGNESELPVTAGKVSMPCFDRMVGWVRLPAGATASLADAYAWGTDYCLASEGGTVTAPGATNPSRINDATYSSIGEPFAGGHASDVPAYNNTNTFPQTYLLDLGSTRSIGTIMAKLYHATDAALQISADGSTWTTVATSTYTKSMERYSGQHRCYYNRYLRPQEIMIWRGPLTDVVGVRLVVNDAMWAERYVPMFDTKAMADEAYDLDTDFMANFTEVAYIRAFNAAGRVKRTVLPARIVS